MSAQNISTYMQYSTSSVETVASIVIGPVTSIKRICLHESVHSTPDYRYDPDRAGHAEYHGQRPGKKILLFTKAGTDQSER